MLKSTIATPLALAVLVALDQDFGMGYQYAVIVQDAEIALE